MTVTPLTRYAINVSGFEGFEYTDVSEESIMYPEAVRFGAREGGVLWSAREAAALCVAVNKQYSTAAVGKATRTGAVRFIHGNRFYIAFDDTINPENNIVIAKAQEGYESHKKNNKFLVPVTDSLVDRVIKRAMNETGRFAEVSIEPLRKLDTDSVDGKSEFGQHPVVQAVLCDVAELFSGMLNQQGRRIGYVWGLTPKDLEELGVNENFVEVRPVRLGKLTVITDDKFNHYEGHACGVLNAREFSVRR